MPDGKVSLARETGKGTNITTKVNKPMAVSRIEMLIATRWTVIQDELTNTLLNETSISAPDGYVTHRTIAWLRRDNLYKKIKKLREKSRNFT